MLQVRAVRVSDLPALECFAEQSGVGMTSLPSDRERLFGRIRRSMASFASDAGRQAIAGRIQLRWMRLLPAKRSISSSMRGFAARTASRLITEPLIKVRR